MDRTTVLIKSAWLSKINWTQGLAMVAMMLTMFGIELDGKTQADIVAGILGAQALVTWVLRTFFTNTVPPSAVK